MNAKKWVFSALLIGVIIFVFLSYISITHICYRDWSWCREYWRPLNDFILPIFVFSLLPFLFSLITYKLPDLVFTRWWRFTRWFIPLAMFLVLIAPGGGGDAIPFPALGIFVFVPMMAIYVLVSVVKIIRAYRETKRNLSPVSKGI